MGKDFKTGLKESNDQAEDIKEIIGELKDFGGHLEGAMAEARTTIDKKSKLKQMEAKAMPGDTTSNAGGEEMDKDQKIDDIISGINKMITLKGDMTLSEAKDFIDSNRNMVKEFI